MPKPHARPHRWAPVRLGAADTTVLSVALVIIGLIRAYDYLTGPDVWDDEISHKPYLVGIEGAFPLWIWGVAILLSVAVLITGMVRRWHFWVFLGHCMLGIIYAGLTVGLFVGYMDKEALDGVRGAVAMLTPAIYCLIVAVRMGAKPLELWRA